ncbi:transposase domain protein [Escherichia coli DEC1D]|nr:transposase domain protein [Escherichia coli DEC1D]
MDHYCTVRDRMRSNLKTGGKCQPLLGWFRDSIPAAEKSGWVI